MAVQGQFIKIFFGEVYGERGIMAIHHISSLARSHDQAHFNKNGPWDLVFSSCKNQLKMRWWCLFCQHL